MPTPHFTRSPATPGLLGRLGGWSVTHRRAIFLVWLVIVGVFGVFAPKVETALERGGNPIARNRSRYANWPKRTLADRPARPLK